MIPFLLTYSLLLFYDVIRVFCSILHSQFLVFCRDLVNEFWTNVLNTYKTVPELKVSDRWGNRKWVIIPSKGKDSRNTLKRKLIMRGMTSFSYFSQFISWGPWTQKNKIDLALDASKSTEISESSHNQHISEFWAMG